MSAAAVAVLQGRASWLLAPVPMASVLGSFAALAYLFATSRAEPRDIANTLVLCLLAAALMLTLWLLIAQGRVRLVRQLASGRLGPTEANLLAAIREVRALPNWLRRAAVSMWWGGAVVVTLALRATGELSTTGQLRIVMVALVVGVMAGVLTYLLAVGRARVLVEAISRHVPAKAVLAALKDEKQMKVRRATVVFVVVMAVLPAVMLAEASRSATQLALQTVAEARRAEQPEVAKAAARSGMAKVVALALLLALLALSAASMSGRNLTEPMRHIADEANRISRGDLREVHIVAAEDETWIITSNFTQMQAQLQEIVGQLQRAGISIGTTTEQLMATSSKYESGAADQASSLNETSATTEELAQSARQISHNAGNVSDLAGKTLDAARAGQDSAKAFVNAVDRMKHDNNSIAEAVTRLEKRVQQIGRIVEFITTVADRSDLLALSAELEGTKAGDVGRGFTLVAAEMRRLAENVIESTNEIEELIGEIREATQETVGATARGMEHTESGTELASAVSQSLEAVVELAQSTSDSVRAISLATQQQQTSTDQLAEAMADILGITQQSLAATKQVTSANHELISLSGDLKGLVEQFQVKQ